MTKKYLIVATFFLLLLALSYGVSRRFKPVPSQPTSPTPSKQNQQPSVTDDWQAYKDDVYDFTLSHPTGWEVQHFSGSADDPDYVIRDLYAFGSGKGEGFELHIYLMPKDKTLRDWCVEYTRHDQGVKIPDEENATIAGLPAYIIVLPATRNSPTEFLAAWAHGGYIFKIEGALSTETFTAMIESIRFENFNYSISLPELPEIHRSQE